MKRGLPAAIYTALLSALISVALAVAIGAVLSLWLEHHNNRQWCPLLNQAVATRPGPHATAGQRQGYAELLTLDRGFGC